MAVYSDEKRPTIAKLIKYSLFINVVFFIILVLLWILRAGPEGGLSYTGTYATILIGLNVASFLIYEQLYRPDDDGIRRLAEILGSLQVVFSCITILILLGTIAMTLSPGLANVLPVAAGAQPVALATLAPGGGATPSATPVGAQPTECYKTSTGCIPYPPAATIPPRGAPISQNDPIIGTYIFDKTQFDPKTNYDSRAGNYEYNYLSVPLDYSPDIKWTFRNDGVLLFYDNADGKLLRTGTWSKTTEGKVVAEYRIVRGNHDYRGSFKENGQFRITSPNVWNMEKV
jgi:hypothetical protein